MKNPKILLIFLFSLSLCLCAVKSSLAQTPVPCTGCFSKSAETEQSVKPKTNDSGFSESTTVIKKNSIDEESNNSTNNQQEQRYESPNVGRVKRDLIFLGTAIVLLFTVGAISSVNH